MKRALVVSGGGNRFFYVAGFYDYLSRCGMLYKHINQYSYFAGSSAGALFCVFLNLYQTKGMIPFNTIAGIKESDIYSYNPYKDVKIWEDGRNYYTSYKLKWSIIWRLLMGKTSLGETRNLYHLLSSMFEYKDYISFCSRGIDLLVTATDYQTGQLVVKSIRDKSKEYNDYCEEDYERFLDFVYASTCASPIMEGYEIEDRYYVDGGFTNNVPITPILNKYDDVDVIDVILLNSNIASDQSKPKNILQSIGRLFNILLYNNASDEIDLSNALATIKEQKLNKDITINILHLCEDNIVHIDPFLFDEKVRDILYREGYEKARLIGKEWHDKVVGNDKEARLPFNSLTRHARRIDNNNIHIYQYRPIF